MKTPNGLTLYDGPSAFDGERIGVIATGTRDPSANRKTGWMIQSYIIRLDEKPSDAKRAGHDVSNCGGCPIKAGCYVKEWQDPGNVFRAFHRGAYPVATVENVREAFGRHGMALRGGSYGDPAAVPRARSFWRELYELASGHTNYTHAHRSPNGRGLKGLAMASVETREQARAAQAKGWKTFRIGAPGDEQGEPGEIRCPYGDPAAPRTTCEQCLLCDGSSANVWTPAHGASAKLVHGRE